MSARAPAARPRPERVGLPPAISACLFDVDGVLTRTVRLHVQAWQVAFDELLAARARAAGAPFVPFDPSHDYREHVDGIPCEDAVRRFLASRGVRLPEGNAADTAGVETVAGVAARKHETLAALVSEGVEVYDDGIAYVHAARRAGLACAVVSASTSCGRVLAAAGIDGLFDVRIDGRSASERGLRGKPAPDTFLAAASDLGVGPPGAAVFEDAVAGVAAARAGGFGFVVGVARGDALADLSAAGADAVVLDLSRLVERLPG